MDIRTLKKTIFTGAGVSVCAVPPRRGAALEAAFGGLLPFLPHEGPEAMIISALELAWPEGPNWPSLPSLPNLIDQRLIPVVTRRRAAEKNTPLALKGALSRLAGAFGASGASGEVAEEEGAGKPGAPGTGNRRTEKRFSWEEDCRVSEEDAYNPRPFTATVDVSKSGMRIRYLGSTIRENSLVRICVRCLKLKSRARIVWSKAINGIEAMSGLRLAEPVPASSLVTAMQGKLSFIPPLVSSKR